MALFPRSATDLRSTSQCPACFTPLRGLLCSRCGLDLAQPAAIDLAAQSAHIADQLDARLALIGRLRRQAAASRVTASPERPAASAERPAAVAPPAPHAPSAPSASPLKEADATRPRRSGVQIALIVVGISLLSVFAVFGLVYAFVAYGSGVRTLIVVAGTLATLAAATVLARRGLGSTAEGIAALGTVILVLDAWALRENDPAGLGSLPALPYWGIALIAVAVVAVGWSAVGRHVSPLLAAAILLPLGAALLAADVTSEAAEGVSSATAGLVAGGTALLSVLVARKRNPAVRAALTVITAIVVLTGLLTALVSTLWLIDSDTVVPGILLGVAAAAVTVLHVAVVVAGAGSSTLSGPGRRVVTSALALLGAVTVIALLISAAATVGAVEVTLGVAILASASLALTAEFALHRWSAPERLAPLVTTAVTAGFSSLVAGLLALLPVLRPLFDAAVVGTFERPGALAVDGAVAVPETAEVAFLATLALGLGLATGVWAIGGVLHKRAAFLAPVLAVILVAAIPFLQTWWVVVTLLSVAALASPLLIGALQTGRPESAPARASAIGGLVTLAPLAALSVALLAWSVDGAGLAGIIVALLALAAGRRVTTDVTARAVAIGVSALLVLTTGPTLADDLSTAGLTVSAEAMVIALAALLLLLSALGRLSRADAGVAAAAATFIGVIVIVSVTGSSVDTTLATAVVVLALAVVGIRRPGVERSIVAALAPLGAAVIVDHALRTASALDALQTTSDERLLATLSALLVVTVIAFATERGRVPGQVPPRVLADAVTLVLLAAALIGMMNGGTRAIGLLIAAVLALVVAVSRDGLLRSASPRRFVGWLALALAMAALWQWLAQRDVTDPEPYVLPLAGALALIGALLARAHRPAIADDTGREHTRVTDRGLDVSGATVAVLAGLAVALLPLALTAGAGPALRGTVVGTLAVLAVVAGLRAAMTSAPSRALAALPGIGAGTVAIAVAAQVVVAASVVVELTETVGPNVLPPLSQLSGVAIVIMLTLTALAAWAMSTPSRSLLVRASAAITAGVAALAAGALGLSAAVEVVEFVSVPLALGLLTIGTIELERRPEARSLLWLSPGFVALLVPSLIAIESDDALWRIVALGLAAAAVFLGGLWRRLQSPFLVGGIVLLTHLLIQSWPLLQDVGQAVEWWLWLGLAGVLVVAIAARYERRVQNLKNVTRRIRDLR